MENEQILDDLISCQLDIIKGIQYREKAMSVKDQMESLSFGTKSLQTLIEVKHSLENNRPTDIALAPIPWVSREGEPAGIVRSLENLAKVFQKPKEVKLV